MNLLVLPISIPLATAALCMLFWQRGKIQQALSLLSAAVQIVAAVLINLAVTQERFVILQSGDWPAPFGITFVVDRLSSIMLLVGAIVSLICMIHARESIDHKRVAYGFYPLANVLMLGVNGSFMTGDLFNLFVWFEVLLISSFVLMALGGEKMQLQGAFKYVAINLLASAVFLSALGLLYGSAGTLNMAHLAQVVVESKDTGYMAALGMMFLVAFGIKAGLFPFYFWLPASYHTPPTVVAAIFGGLLTKVGIYALLRIFSLVLIEESDLFMSVLLAIACVTMVLGGLGAIVQTNIRRAVAFSMLTGIGAMAFGISLDSRLGYAATVMYMVHSAFATTAIFMLAGLINKKCGSFDIRKVGGLYAAAPVLSLAVLAVGLSMAGFPPFSGFLPKVGLLNASLPPQAYWGVLALLISSLLTLAAYVRIWIRSSWMPAQVISEVPRGPAVAATASAVALVLAFPFFANAIFVHSEEAGQDLYERSNYVQAVLKEES